MKAFQALLLIALVGSVFSLYGSNSKVVKLTQANFREKVINSKEVWFVEFYAPWCGHCKNLAPEFDKLANALDGIIRVGAVDMTTDQQAGAPYNVKGFPTLKVFGADKNKPTDYNGGRTANEMMNFAFQQAKDAANARLGGRRQSSGGSSSNSGGSGGSGSDKDVVVLDDSNFDSLVMGSDEVWLVEFYAPWCGHCKRLEPEWNSAASKLKGEVKVAKLDATQNQQQAGKFGVQGYPTIKLFPAGPKSADNVISYEGARDAGSITSWALEQKAKSKPAPKVEQLINKDVFDTHCAEIRGICFIAFVPHMYDSSVKERKDFVKMFEELAKAHRTSPITFIWAQGGDHYEFEESLALGSGYPSLVAISVKKEKYSSFRGAFTKKGIDTFMKALVSGKESVFPLPKGVDAKIKKVKAWDGKEAKQQTEDDL